VVMVLQLVKTAHIIKLQFTDSSETLDKSCMTVFQNDKLVLNFKAPVSGE